MFTVIQFVVFAGILYIAIRVFAQWRENNNAPIETTNARVIDKKIDTMTHQNAVAPDGSGNMGYHTTMTENLLVTFETQDGDIRKFTVTGQEFRDIPESAEGELTFQGTRFIGFRNIKY